MQAMNQRLRAGDLRARWPRRRCDSPGFALAHWGIAYASGPNHNKQSEAFDPVDLAASLEKAFGEVVTARACADRAAPASRR